MRVPPDQSGTAFATSETARSMSRCPRCFVMRVSRVANKNASMRLSSPA